MLVIEILHNNFDSTEAAVKLFNNSSLIINNNNQKKSTKIYLSDLLKEIDQNNSSSKNIQIKTKAINTTPKIIKTTTQLPKALTLEEFLNQTSTVENDFDSDYFHNTGPYCKVNYRKISIKISDECQSFNYPMVECTGYCQSQSMIWKNHDNIQTASCCSMINVYEKSAKLYCTKRLQQNEIKKDFYRAFKDDEVAKLFQESFDKNSWKSHKVVFKGKKLYTGYYTVKIYYNATCECEYLD